MSTPDLPPRTRAAQLFMAAPLVFGGLLMLSVVVLAVLVVRGFSPDGERIAVHLAGPCLAEAQPTIQARIDAIGLGAPAIAAAAGGEALVVEVTLPGQDAAAERQSIPRLLSRRGALAVRDGEEVVADGSAVAGVSLELDANGAAMAVVELEAAAAEALAARVRADPQGELTIWLDEERVAVRPNTALVAGRRLEIIGPDGLPRARMAAAAEQVVLLQRAPLPCALEVSSVVAGGDVE